jgi:hypothetical protein
LLFFPCRQQAGSTHEAVAISIDTPALDLARTVHSFGSAPDIPKQKFAQPQTIH